MFNLERYLILHFFKYNVIDYIEFSCIEKIVKSGHKKYFRKKNIIHITAASDASNMIQIPNLAPKSVIFKINLIT